MVDLVILILYVFTMIMLIDNGFDLDDEFLEFGLIFSRYFLQIARIVVYIDR